VQLLMPSVPVVSSRTRLELLMAQLLAPANPKSLSTSGSSTRPHATNWACF